jgi:hypothetical protein
LYLGLVGSDLCIRDSGRSATRRSTTTEAQPAGDRSSGHDPYRPPAQPVHSTSGLGALRFDPEWPPAAQDQPRAARAAAGQYSDRPHGPVADPQLPPSGEPGAGRGPRSRARVREVPRTHARPGGCLRAVVHRLARDDDHPGPGTRGRGPGRPGRARPPGDRSSRTVPVEPDAERSNRLTGDSCPLRDSCW